MDSLLTLGIGVGTFAATNIDDIYVLVACFLNPNFRARDVVAGQFFGMAVLIFGSLALSMIAGAAFPKHMLHWLGIVPVFLGTKELYPLFRHRGDRDNVSLHPTSPFRMLSVTAMTIGNGGDNVAAYTPLFSAQSQAHQFITVTVFFLMTGLWCWLGRYVARHPVIGAPIRRWGHIILPFVLISLGVVILTRG